MGAARWLGGVLAAAGIVFLAVSISGQPASQPGANMPLPPLRVGDAGEYQTADGLVTTFEFIQADPWLDQAGTLRSGLALLLDAEGEFGRYTWHSIEADGSSTASRARLGGGGTARGLGIGPGDTTSGIFSSAYRTTPTPAAWPCGMEAGLRPLDLADETIMLRSCGMEPLEALGPADVDAPRRTYGETRRLVLDARLPVPWSISDGNGEWTLTKFRRGDEIPRWNDIGSARFDVQPFPDIPDESGLDLEFPLRAALDWAIGVHPANPLRDYLATHPDAYVAEAGYLELIEPEGRTLRWDVTAADGRTGQRVFIERLWTQDGPTAPGLVTTVSEQSVRDRPYPDPGAVIRAAVSLDSLAAAWSMVAAAPAWGEPVNGWGLQVTCLQTCEGAGFNVWVGVNQTRSDVPGHDVRCGAECTSTDWAWVADQILVDAGGAFVHRVHTEWSFFQEASVDRRPAFTTTRVHYEDDPETLDEAHSTARLARPSLATVTGLSLIAVALTFVAMAWSQLKSLFWGTFFARYKDMNHPVRNACLKAIEEGPGIHYSELLRRTGAGQGQLRHHLNVLLDAGLIERHTESNYHCFYLKRDRGRRLRGVSGPLKATAAQKILQNLQAEGRPMGDLARAIDANASTVTYHVGRLKAAGLVEWKRDGRHVLVSITRHGVRALEEARL